MIGDTASAMPRIGYHLDGTRFRHVYQVLTIFQACVTLGQYDRRCTGLAVIGLTPGYHPAVIEGAFGNVANGNAPAAHGLVYSQ